MLIGTSFLSYQLAKKVSNELVEISRYSIPLRNMIAGIDSEIAEQEIDLERIFRLYEVTPPNHDRIQDSHKRFEDRNAVIDNQIQTAIRLANDALNHMDERHEIVEFARFEPVLRNIEEQHQKFHDQGRQIIHLLAGGKQHDARLLENELETERENADDQIGNFLIHLEKLTNESASSVEALENHALNVNVAIVAFTTIFGLLFAYAITAGIVRPIKLLLEGTQAVEAGNLEVQLPIRSKDEIGDLTHVFNNMVRDIRDKERIKATFGQFLDPRIVDQLVRESAGQINNEKQVMTVFFSDIAGFSAISEMLTPGGLVNLINEYLNLANEPIMSHRGVIDKFIGDAIVAFWGPPFTSPSEHARLACIAALEQFAQLEILRRKMPDIMGFRKGLPKISIRVGLASGELIAGNIGSEQSKSFTIIGEAAEIAEELEGANKAYATNILITEITRQLAGDSVETRKIDLLPARGNQRPQYVYELLSRKGELDESTRELRDVFEDALKSYRNQSWKNAVGLFESCLKLKPGDGPSKVYLKRLQLFNQKPPGSGWDGVFMDGKT